MRAKRSNLNKNCEITRIIGLMSGTSHDGIDAALVQFACSRKRFDARLIQHLHLRYRKELRGEIRRAFNGSTELICRLNFRLGEVFAKAALSVLEKAGIKPADIDAIASHGQTICHLPPSRPGGRGMGRNGATLQIGESAVIAERTGILTISDFRTADMAAGGQGAPLVPLADYLLFHSPGRIRAVVNIGGIANVTIIGKSLNDTVAFDTGPGNCLIDEAMLFCSGGDMSFDRNGNFAKAGVPVHRLLNELLAHPYFRRRPPKSTGRETFGSSIIHNIFRRFKKTSPQDIVSTLTHLTARTIHDAVIRFEPHEVILTGGGAMNLFLRGILKESFEKNRVLVSSISDYGIPIQAKEAMSFAIIGYHTLNFDSGNIPAATGARHKAILGKLAYPTNIK